MKKVILHLSLITCLTACNNSSGGKGSQKTSGQSSLKAEAKEAFDLVNQERSKAGLSPFKEHAFTNQVSSEHSYQMATKQIPFGHSGFSQRYDEITAHDPSVTSIAENVAKHPSAQSAVKGWMGSYGHRKNILGNYTHAGMGAEVDKFGNWYFTQVFLRK